MPSYFLYLLLWCCQLMYCFRFPETGLTGLNRVERAAFVCAALESGSAGGDVGGTNAKLFVKLCNEPHTSIADRCLGIVAAKTDSKEIMQSLKKRLKSEKLLSHKGEGSFGGSGTWRTKLRPGREMQWALELQLPTHDFQQALQDLRGAYRSHKLHATRFPMTGGGTSSLKTDFSNLGIDIVSTGEMEAMTMGAKLRLRALSNSSSSSSKRTPKNSRAGATGGPRYVDFVYGDDGTTILVTGDSDAAFAHVKAPVGLNDLAAYVNMVRGPSLEPLSGVDVLRDFEREGWCHDENPENSVNKTVGHIYGFDEAAVDSIKKLGLAPDTVASALARVGSEKVSSKRLCYAESIARNIVVGNALLASQLAKSVLVKLTSKIPELEVRYFHDDGEGVHRLRMPDILQKKTLAIVQRAQAVTKPTTSGVDEFLTISVGTGVSIIKTQKTQQESIEDAGLNAQKQLWSSSQVDRVGGTMIGGGTALGFATLAAACEDNAKTSGGADAEYKEDIMVKKREYESLVNKGFVRDLDKRAGASPALGVYQKLSRSFGDQVVLAHVALLAAISAEVYDIDDLVFVGGLVELPHAQRVIRNTVQTFYRGSQTEQPQLVFANSHAAAEAVLESFETLSGESPACSLADVEPSGSTVKK